MTRPANKDLKDMSTAIGTRILFGKATLAALSLPSALIIAVLFAGGATAQQSPAQDPKPSPPAAAVAKPQAPSQPQTKSAQPSPANESGLKTRVESLEEQLVDMQVVVGTLESLAKSGGSSASPAYRTTAGGDGARVESLENQVRTLSAQVQQLSDQVRSLGGNPRRSEYTPPSAPGSSSDFGSTTVSQNDAIGGMIAGEAPAISSGPPIPDAGGGISTPSAGATPVPVVTAALPPAGDGSNPKQLYETAYGYLLQRDYGAAEAAFDDFLKRHPSDSLSGNAQYWLGESHFVRGQYKAAASAFLKGYQTYGQSQKAPDSLLKLAMSLDRLGQRDAACSSYAELNIKFPNAPQSVKARAQSERQRVGCP
jgi:tol-pal system protein YbgF